MKFIGWVALLALVGCAVAGEGAEEPREGRTSSAIIDGKPSSDAEDAVVLIVGQSPEGQYQCSGTLLAPNLVLTARHCVASTDEQAVCASDGTPQTGGRVRGDYDPSSLAIVTGAAVEPGNVEPAAHGKKLFVPEADTLCNHDIALVLLDRKIDGAKIAPLRLKALPSVGEELEAVGWGLTEEGTFTTRRLKREGIPVLRLGPVDTIGDAEIEIGEGICSGDSGGPALTESSRAIVGVVSRGGGGTGAQDNRAGNCIGKTTRNLYTAVAPFSDLVKSAFASAGAKPWLEGEPSPWIEEVGHACTSRADCSSSLCVRSKGAGVCTVECSASECPTGYTCGALDGTKVCTPSGSALPQSSAITPGAPAVGTSRGGGCRAARGADLGDVFPALLVVVALLAMRRRASLLFGVLAACSPSAGTTAPGTGANASAEQQKPTGLAGIYVGEHFSSTYNVNISGEPGSGYWTNSWDRRELWLRGQEVLYHVPRGGFVDADFDTACAAKPGNCGTWSRDGDAMTIAWNDGSKPSKASVVNDDQLSFGAVRLDKITTHATVTLDGTYTYQDYQQSAAGRATSDSRTVKSLVFHADGKFEATATFNSSLQVKGPDGDSNGSVQASGWQKENGSGTYAVDHHVLTLHYDSGHDVPLTYWDIGDGAAYVALDAVTYEKEK